VHPLSHLTSCIPIKSNLYLTNSLATVRKWPWPTEAPHIPCTKSYVPFQLLRLYERVVLVRGKRICFITRLVCTVQSCKHLVQPPSGRITPRRLSMTANSIYSQLLSILEAVHLHSQDAACRSRRDPLVMKRCNQFYIFRQWTRSKAWIILKVVGDTRQYH
jgi:hypothetical protein